MSWAPRVRLDQPGEFSVQGVLVDASGDRTNAQDALSDHRRLFAVQPAQQVDQPCPFVRVKAAHRPEVDELKATVRANEYVSRMRVGVKYAASQHLPQHESE